VGKDGRFKKPLSQDKLAIIIVKSMLLVGFDAPVEQVMYLDRFMHGHELLQAIARVNRRYPGKTRGLVVDYFGVGDRLTEALEMYARHDIKGALINIKDELPKLDDRHRRVLSLFQERGIDDISDIDACVDELRDVRLRAEFINKFKEFTESMDIILPRPEALPYIYEMKLLGFINKAASNRYRDSQLNIAGVGTKVRQLIDEHIVAQGIDPKTQAPFLGILLEEYGKQPDENKMKQFCEAVIDMVDHIQQEIASIDFWRSRHAQDMLRLWIINEVDDLDLIPFNKQEKLAVSVRIEDPSALL